MRNFRAFVFCQLMKNQLNYILELCSSFSARGSVTSTTAREWAMRVVRRISTGIRNRSESSNAAFTMS